MVKIRTKWKSSFKKCSMLLAILVKTKSNATYKKLTSEWSTLQVAIFMHYKTLLVSLKDCLSIILQLCLWFQTSKCTGSTCIYNIILIPDIGFGGSALMWRGFHLYIYYVPNSFYLNHTPEMIKMLFIVMLIITLPLYNYN